MGMLCDSSLWNRFLCSEELNSGWWFVTCGNCKNGKKNLLSLKALSSTNQLIQLDKNIVKKQSNGSENNADFTNPENF